MYVTYLSVKYCGFRLNDDFSQQLGTPTAPLEHSSTAPTDSPQAPEVSPRPAPEDWPQASGPSSRLGPESSEEWSPTPARHLPFQEPLLSRQEGRAQQAAGMEPPEPEAVWRRTMDEMAKASTASYRELVRETPDFIRFFRTATPERKVCL